ncbi:MAG: cupin domain-containing protein [Spirochaetales bacterium]|nr:cupin domain-containing protein [Spirochaetales bacterium]
MVIKREDMKSEVRHAMRGGDGSVKITHLESKDNMKNCRLLCELTIPPGAGVGEHEHIDETEYYIITAGEGTVVDNGTEVPVKAGELVVTGHKETHSISNTGTVDLTMIAVIITY